MAQFKDSDDFIASVKRRAMIPTSQSTFTDADFLSFANEEIAIGLVPSILRLHEDYFLYTESIPLSEDITAYTIPSRAIGNKVREVSYKDTNGNIFEMTRIGVGDLPDYNQNHNHTQPYLFYIKNNKIVLVADLASSPSGSLEVTYYMRPNELVATSRAAKIIAIDTATGVLTLKTAPSVFSLTDDDGNTQKFDIIKGQSPHCCLAIDLVPSSYSGAARTITLAVADLPDDLAVGDYINLAHETIIPQVPSDLHVVLSHRVATRCLEALGDTEGLTNANKKLAEMEDRTTNLIDNRVEDSPRKVFARHNFLRRRR